MNDDQKDPPLKSLFEEIVRARKVVGTVQAPTPMDRINLPDGEGSFLLKREDHSPVFSFKWRGAFYKLDSLVGNVGQTPVVTASAGNHAQGVAMSAERLGMKTTIFMPESTPQIKVRHVRRFGQATRIRLEGDCFDETAYRARQYAAKHDAIFIEPFDDLEIIAGQGTIGDEMARSPQRFDTVYVPVGGGGLVSGVACGLKCLEPSIRVIGVEVAGQASMTRSIQSGRITTLPRADSFCDGTAVKTPGELTFAYCKKLVDEFVEVTNDEVCTAIEFLWEQKRVVAEPSGAIGIAAILKFQDRHRSNKAATILTGANLDFTTFSKVARRNEISHRSQTISEPVIVKAT